MTDTAPFDEYPLRAPCKECGIETGYIVTRNGQDVVRCDQGHYQYNAPKTETGRKPRTVSTVHEAIKPKQRARILLRANGRCELCGDNGNMHVGHLISVKRGLEHGMTETDLNSDENLCCMCDQCNLGVGKEPVPIRFAVALAMARLRGNENGD